MFAFYIKTVNSFLLFYFVCVSFNILFHQIIPNKAEICRENTVKYKYFNILVRLSLALAQLLFAYYYKIKCNKTVRIVDRSVEKVY